LYLSIHQTETLHTTLLHYLFIIHIRHLDTKRSSAFLFFSFRQNTATSLAALLFLLSFISDISKPFDKQKPIHFKVAIASGCCAFPPSFRLDLLIPFVLSTTMADSKRASLASEASLSPNLDAAFESASRRAQQYEVQMREVETMLANDLSNSRAIDNLLREVVTGLQNTQRRSKTALSVTVPHIVHSLRKDSSILQGLDHDLPQVGLQVNDIRGVYDRGKEKAQDLMESLEWLNTPVPLRLRAIIFTPNAPVSPRWKALLRFLFALAFLACMWIAWITIRGAVRAHRHRLVWGERLMS